MTSITVGTSDLRAALVSVAPHAAAEKDSPKHRVRIQADDQNVWVTATNGSSAGLAIASTEDLIADEETDATVDLHPTEVKEILTLFKASGTSEDDYPDERLRIDINRRHTTITETGGLFEGKALTLPRRPIYDQFPDLAATIYKHLNDAGSHGTERILTSGIILGLFTAAAKAYSKSVVVEPVGISTALVVSCGESFLGLLINRPATDEQNAELNEWRQAWTGRLTRRTKVLEPA